MRPLQITLFLIAFLFFRIILSSPHLTSGEG